MLQFDGNEWVAYSLAAREPIGLPACLLMTSFLVCLNVDRAPRPSFPPRSSSKQDDRDGR